MTDDELTTLTEEIDRTRADLAASVTQLSEKFDVKAQVSSRFHRATQSAAPAIELARRNRTVLLAGAAALLAVTLIARRDRGGKA
ncbi:uncharacterized protein DUF3618 [Jatrophihabitans sp. GAS493]|uniref:DUF3618 domain-containing protein n=1 Tax=Jatrophihabitans sp. GAS493 TaxID=1907575 RepID=UPI000BB676C7|nr:DUF3618 domain-containing protein [Jatrophihabitans sp. GAS493]SOD74929.1 uncharacterized protein DUF3618 [Jatrophihabitans sp. GAS493]